MPNKNLVIGIIAVTVVIFAAAIFAKQNPAPADNNKLDDFAKCLTEKGAKMYGAFWCGHCKSQKQTFGSSFQYINHQECTVDGKSNSFAQACKDADIKGYPTWKFLDGTVKVGEVSFGELAEKTGCGLPEKSE